MFKIRTQALLWTLLALKITANVSDALDQPCRFGVNDFGAWINDDGSLRFPTASIGNYNVNASTAGKGGVNTPIRDNEELVCQFSKDSNDVTCKDSIDYAYLKQIRNQHIRTLFIDSYNVKENIKRIQSNSSEEFAKSFTWKMTGELKLRDIHVEMSTILDLKIAEFDKLIINGEAFSNKVIKVGWKYRGEAVWSSKENVFTAELNIYSTDYDNGWNLHATIELFERIAAFRGEVLYTGNGGPPIRFEGSFGMNVTGSECTFTGQLEGLDSDVAGDFHGRVTKLLSMEVTIPQGAFSKMNIQNLIFKKSYFFGDFHKNAFEGINQLETITFYQSKMEFMPQYDRMFRRPTLKEIRIEECNTPTISTGSECSLTNLELLSFKGSGFLEFSNKSFYWLSCSNLTFLNFRETNFKLISNESILLPVARTLKYLDVSYSTLNQETSLRQFLTGTKLTHLNLAGLKLKRVPTSALEVVSGTVKYLSLSKNSFEKIPGENMLVSVLNFPKMQYLSELDLHGCRINYIEKRAFNPLENLKKLDLSDNNFMNLQDGWLDITPGIVYLNLSYNAAVTRASMINLLHAKDVFDLSMFGKLETLDLSNSKLLDNKSLILNENNNLKYLSLCKCGLKTLNDSVFHVLTDVNEMDLSGNPSLGKTSPFKRLNQMKSLKILHFTHSGIVNITFVSSEIRMNLEYIDLSNNYIKVICTEFFKSLPYLKTLKVSNNNLSHLPKGFPASALGRIYIDNNKIETLSSNIIENLGSLDEFTLGRNPFLCGYYVLEFVKRVRETSSGYYSCPEFVNRTEVETFRSRNVHSTSEILLNASNRSVYLYRGQCAKIVDWPGREYQCYSPSTRKILNFLEVDDTLEECLPDIATAYFDWLSLLTTAVLLTCFFVAFLWWKWWNFRLFARMLKSAAVASFISEDGDTPTTFDYDAFVSYAESDRGWITEQLIPHLERLQDVKICLHERDFQVGLSILENIVSSIDKSKCIILVLSQAFVKSQWCQYEMHLAYHRLLETRRDQMILILLENIPRYKRPRTLQYLMMTKTYIKWPSNNANIKDVEIFWNRLFKALHRINEI